MDSIPVDGQKELEQLIVKNVPRDALMACDDAYFNGDLKGRTLAASFVQGHRPSAAGQVKHFFTNEFFHEALEANGAKPTPLRGTRLVVGRLGIFNVVRLNVPGHKWTNINRSATRKALAELNASIQRQYVQSDLFQQEGPNVVAEGTLFILGVMDGLDSNGIAQLTQVMIALPTPDMKSWLYLAPMASFLMLYGQPEASGQPDNAKPKLRAQPKKQTGNDEGN